MPDEPITRPHRAVGTPLRPSNVPKVREACLVFLYGEAIGRRIPLSNAPVHVGRAAECDLVLEDESVSRRHCRLEPMSLSGDDDDPDAWRLVDLGSTNGTFVNDRSTPACVLKHGDRVQFGRNICKFLAGGHVESTYYEEIHRLVTTDGLTGLHNRRSFEELLTREFSRANRYHRPLALIAIDIDHFKRLNDTLGHLAGDAALRQLGALLRANVRRDDIVGRLGGEEFAILLPEIDREGAVRVADKLRELVRDARFQYEGVRTPFTISAGVAMHSESDTDPLALLGRADELLYAAKRGGRDQVKG